MTDGEWLTYTEAARRLGTTPDAIRQRVKRGQMQGSRGNDGRPRVWTDARPGGQVTEPSPDKSPNGPNRTESDLSGQIKALEDHIETLKGLLIAEVERTQIARDEAQQARAEADHAKADQVRMARDIANMFEDLRAVAARHAELHADRARLQAELESAHARIIELQAESAQVRKEVADERVHSGTLVNQFERVHREHRTNTEQARRRWWHRWFKR
jgi:hypothetical protein